MADFPRVKWLNIDGQQVPFTEPQHFTGNGDETVRTGKDNPLPVANYTKKGNIWLPVSEENPVPTQVTGRNVEKQYLFNATAVTTNEIIESDVVDLSPYKKVTILLQNNLEVPVTLYLDYRGSFRGFLNYYDGNSWKRRYKESSVPDAGYDVYNINSLFPELNENIFDKIRIRIQAETAPTSGSITAYVLGVKN